MVVAGEDDGDEGGIEEMEEDERLVAIGFDDALIRRRSIVW